MSEEVDIYAETVATPHEATTLPPPARAARSEAVTERSQLRRPEGRVGPYVLERKLAQGGMGAVYVAWSTSLERRVALKLLLKEDDRHLRERFLIEARAAARLRHPNVVAVHEVGQAQGRLYLVMDLVEGESLADRVQREGPLDPRRAAEIVRKLAEALQQAHSQAILHRDVKPANVLLNAEDEPLLTDFGLAKDLRQSQGHTRSGDVLGTPAYMPPEQAGGQPERVDHRADVYSLGATLYELLTARPPFVGGRVLEVLSQVTTKVPEPPRKLRPELPRDLDTIVRRCLEKEPELRYGSAAELGEDLRRFLEHRPILARPATPLESLGKWIRRNRRVAGAVGATSAAAALLAITLLVGFLVRLSAEQEQTRAALEQARANGRRAERFAEERGQALARARVSEREALTSLRESKERAARVRDQHAVALRAFNALLFETRRRVRARVGQDADWATQRQRDKDVDQLMPLRLPAGAALPDQRAEFAHALARIGALRLKELDPVGADYACQQAVEILERVPGSPGLGSALLGWGHAKLALEDEHGAYSAWSRALPLLSGAERARLEERLQPLAAMVEKDQARATLQRSFRRATTEQEAAEALTAAFSIFMREKMSKLPPGPERERMATEVAATQAQVAARGALEAASRTKRRRSELPSGRVALRDALRRARAAGTLSRLLGERAFHVRDDDDGGEVALRLCLRARGEGLAIEVVRHDLSGRDGRSELRTLLDGELRLLETRYVSGATEGLIRPEQGRLIARWGQDRSRVRSYDSQALPTTLLAFLYPLLLDEGLPARAQAPLYTDLKKLVHSYPHELRDLGAEPLPCGGVLRRLQIYAREDRFGAISALYPAGGGAPRVLRYRHRSGYTYTAIDAAGYAQLLERFAQHEPQPPPPPPAPPQARDYLAPPGRFQVGPGARVGQRIVQISRSGGAESRREIALVGQREGAWLIESTQSVLGEELVFGLEVDQRDGRVRRAVVLSEGQVLNCPLPAPVASAAQGSSEELLHFTLPGGAKVLARRSETSSGVSVVGVEGAYAGALLSAVGEGFRRELREEPRRLEVEVGAQVLGALRFDYGDDLSEWRSAHPAVQALASGLLRRRSPHVETFLSAIESDARPRCPW